MTEIGAPEAPGQEQSTESMSSVNPAGELTRQLAEFAAKISDPFAVRLRTASVRISRLHDPHGPRRHRGGARRSQ
jgi:hypothetical protein